MPNHKLPPRTCCLLLTLLLAAATTRLPAQSAPVLQAPTITALSTSAARFPYGAPVTLTAALTPATSTGTLTLTDNNQPLAQLPLTSGAATLTSTTFAPGPHSVVATYPGDTSDAPSASPPLTFTIDPDPTSLTLSAEPASAPFGTLPPLTVSITPSSATGPITLTDTAGTLFPLTSLANGTAIFSLASLTPGSHTLTATYPGNAHDRAATSPALSLIVTPAVASVVLTLSPATAAWGTPILLAAQATPNTGVIAFTDSIAGPLGQASVLPTGQATLSVSILAAGLHLLTATRAADPAIPPPPTLSRS